jgi:branched-chain amino acid transport system substrate-binding protein
LGIGSKAAIEIAVSDINEYLQKSGSPYVFSSTIYDTKLDTTLTIKFIKEANAAGIKYFVGPQASASIAAIRDYVNANNLLIVSQGSTASSLAIPNDGIFRFCPGDAIEGPALATSARLLGCQHMISIARNDAGNLDLQKAVESKFTSLGGTISKLPAYPMNQTDFSTLLSALKPVLQTAINSYGASKVCVFLSSFDECTQLFQQANTDPVFSSVRWIGADGVVLSQPLISNPQAAAFAATTQFFAPNFGLPMPSHPDYERVVAYIKSKSGLEPDAYTMAAYDATWVIAKSLINFPNPPSKIQDLIPVFQLEAKRFYGLTGPLQLNDAGDRNNGTFDYWGVALENGTYKWKWVGRSN